MPKCRWQTMGGVLAVACAVVAVTASVGVSASSGRSYRYVAAGFHVVGPDYAAGVVAEETGVRTAPLGYVGLVPESDRFTLRVVDDNPLSASVAVTMVAEGGWRRHVCAPRDRDVVLDGVPAGKHVSLFVWEAVAYHEDWCPSSRASTGTLTVTP